MMRGPGCHGEGKTSKKEFEWKNFNIPIPARPAIQKKLCGYALGSGIIRNFLMSYLKISSHGDSGVRPLHESDLFKVIPVCLSQDGMVVKPGLTYDKYTHKIVGLSEVVDINFIRENPHPTKEFLRSKMVTTAEASVITSLDGQFSLPVGVKYITKGGTAEAVLSEIKKEVAQLQTCESCLKTCHGIIMTENTSCSTTVCERCIGQGSLCEGCSPVHSSIYPALRRCDQCVRDKLKCNRLAVLANSQDCEAKYKAAMVDMQKNKSSDDIMMPFPDMSHNGKNLKSPSVNWWPVVDGKRSNILILRVLRSSNETLRKIVPLRAVRGRDRMDVDDLLSMTSLKCTQTLMTIPWVVVTVVPELFRVFETNKVGILQHPLYITMYGNRLALSDISKGEVYTVTMHYPATVHLCVNGLNKPMGLASSNDVLIIAEQGQKRLLYYDPKKTLKIDPKKMKVEQLKAELVKRGESVAGLLKDGLQKLLSTVLSKNLPEMVKPATYVLDTLENPPADVAFDADRLYVLTESNVTEMSLEKTGNGLVSHKIRFIQIGFENPRSLTITLDHKAFITTRQSVIKVDLESTHVTKCADSSSPFGIGFMQDSQSVLFTDQEEKVIKEITFENNDHAAVNVIAGTENTDCSVDGTSNTCKFSQPTGIFVEGKTIFLCDTATGRVRIITQPSGLAMYLKHIGSMLRAFKITQRKQEPENHTLQEIIDILQESLEFFTRIHEEAKIRCNKDHVQGPDGSPPKCTIESVGIVLDSLKKLKVLLSTENPDYELEVKALMTLVCERLFSIMRALYEMPNPFQFCRHFGRSVTETLKSITSVGFHYFTSVEKDFYPVPSSFVTFTDLPKLPKPAVSEVSKASEEKLKEWAKVNGQSVRQQSVRSLSTKDKPGTLPIELYEAPQEVYQPLDLFQPSNESHMQSETSDDVSSVVYEKDSIVVVRDTSYEHGFIICSCTENITSVSKSAEFFIFTADTGDDMRYILECESTVRKDLTDVVQCLEQESLVGNILMLEDDTLSQLIMKCNGNDNTETCAALNEIEAEESSSSSEDETPILSAAVSRRGRPIVTPLRYRRDT